MVRFSDGNFVMRLGLDMAIEIGNAKLDEKFNLFGEDVHLFLFAQFGHELTHHQQGYINAVSIQGEYLASHPIW